MSYLSNTSIRGKLLFTFIAIICFALAVGAFAVQRLGAVVAEAVVMRDTGLPSVRVLGMLAYDTERFRQLEAAYALAEGSDDRAKVAAKLATVMTQVKADFSGYAALIDAPASLDRKVAAFPARCGVANASLALKNLRGAVILVVVAFHSSLAYLERFPIDALRSTMAFAICVSCPTPGNAGPSERLRSSESSQRK